MQDRLLLLALVGCRLLLLKNWLMIVIVRRMLIVMTVVVALVIVIVALVIVVVAMVVMHSIDNNIIMRVAVIRDKDAAIIVACEFDLGCINLIDGGQNALSISLNDGLVLVHSGGCNLSVN